ncbi:hypothetical protein [Photobacterium leiognathi]|uniref:Uncharacterized protein n=1 Tax=Photobacterium leiognathi TaxID=553611 RepID=A0A2T3M7N4_PHOLE|nr:hypothetical protein [Photobacterium leiognathi]KJF93338.1 hypothetical protein UB34_19920 [Photobacterium leiognathi]PSV88281.1 hypothetical protein CTM89_15050 [Photobacterium leiognathi]
MSQQLLDKLKNDKDFSLFLKKRSLEIKGGKNTDSDRKRSVEMIAGSPEEIEKLEAAFCPIKADLPTILTTLATTVSIITTFIIDNRKKKD